VRTGMYKDDLARVVEVDSVGGRAVIKLLHRLDFPALGSRVWLCWARAWLAL
jgi:transcription elongation factor SPT5